VFTGNLLPSVDIQQEYGLVSCWESTGAAAAAVSEQQ
jgi:hypothetical protein